MSLRKTTAFLVAMLVMSLPMPVVGQSGVVHNHADSVSDKSLACPRGLDVALSSIIVNGADSAVDASFNRSQGLVDTVDQSIVVKRADSNVPYSLVDIPSALQALVNRASATVIVKRADWASNQGLVYPLELLGERQIPEVVQAPTSIAGTQSPPITESPSIRTETPTIGSEVLVSPSPAVEATDQAPETPQTQPGRGSSWGLPLAVLGSVLGLLIVAGLALLVRRAMASSHQSKVSSHNGLSFEQIDDIVNEDLREKVKRAIALLDLDNVDAGLFMLGKEFEATLKRYLEKASSMDKITPPRGDRDKWNLAGMIACAQRNGIIADRGALEYLRAKRNERAHGSMPSLRERQILMDNVELVAGIYIDYIRLFDDLFHDL